MSVESAFILAVIDRFWKDTGRLPTIREMYTLFKTDGLLPESEAERVFWDLVSNHQIVIYAGQIVFAARPVDTSNQATYQRVLSALERIKQIHSLDENSPSAQRMLGALAQRLI